MKRKKVERRMLSIVFLSSIKTDNIHIYVFMTGNLTEEIDFQDPNL